MTLLVAAGLAGMTGGGGPMSHDRITIGRAMVTYPAVSRWQMADELAIDLRASNAETRITLPTVFLDTFAVENITPAPRLAWAGGNGHSYVFAIRGGDRPARIRFAVRALRPRWPRLPMPIAIDGQSATIAPVILP